MMTAEMKKEKEQLCTDLINLLINCEDDVQNFRRLTWSLEFISNILTEDYTDLVKRGFYQRNLEEILNLTNP